MQIHHSTHHTSKQKQDESELFTYIQQGNELTYVYIHVYMIDGFYIDQQFNSRAFWNLSSEERPSEALGSGAVLGR